MGSKDELHAYRLPTEEEWILAAGHMPKDVKMNSDYVEKGLTAVDAYAETTGACGGIDFWGNSWEWTSTQNTAGLYIVKGGSWDSSRDACRSEYSDDVRDASGKYANVKCGVFTNFLRKLICTGILWKIFGNINNIEV